MIEASIIAPQTRKSFLRVPCLDAVTPGYLGQQLHLLRRGRLQRSGVIGQAQAVVLLRRHRVKPQELIRYQAGQRRYEGRDCPDAVLVIVDAGHDRRAHDQGHAGRAQTFCIRQDALVGDSGDGAMALRVHHA